MKKFYAFAVAALAAVSMNGQVYLCGNWDQAGTNLGWNPAAPLEFEKNADGNWELTVETIQSFKISTVKAETGKTDADGNVIGDWDQFNGAALGFEGEITDAMVGVPQNLEPWGENLNLPWEGKWKFVVSADYTTLTFTTTTPKPEGFTKCYVMGGMNGWKADDAWLFTTTDGKVYTFACEGDTKIEAGVEFKIASGNWTGINYSTGGIVFADGEMMPASYDIQANMTFSEDFEGEIKLELVNGQGQEAELYFTPKGSDGVADIELDNNAAVEYFNLQGVRVANPENGLFIARQGSKVVKVVK